MIGSVPRRGRGRDRRRSVPRWRWCSAAGTARAACPSPPTWARARPGGVAQAVPRRARASPERRGAPTTRSATSSTPRCCSTWDARRTRTRRARIWGDDIAAVRLAFLTDFAEPKDVWRTWVSGLAESTGQSRARVLATTVSTGRKVERASPRSRPARSPATRPAGSACRSRCRTACSTPPPCGTARATRPTSGEAIPLSTRLMHVASTAVLFALHAGDGRRRRGGAPPCRAPSSTRRCAMCSCRAAELLDGIDDLDAYE